MYFFFITYLAEMRILVLLGESPTPIPLGHHCWWKFVLLIELFNLHNNNNNNTNSDPLSSQNWDPLSDISETPFPKKYFFIFCSSHYFLSFCLKFSFRTANWIRAPLSNISEIPFPKNIFLIFCSVAYFMSFCLKFSFYMCLCVHLLMHTGEKPSVCVSISKLNR